LAKTATDYRCLYAGLVRLHVLYEAVKEPVYGLAVIEELGRQGCKLSAGPFTRSFPDWRRRASSYKVRSGAGYSVRHAYPRDIPCD
jgi:hypothetical protein